MPTTLLISRARRYGHQQAQQRSRASASVALMRQLPLDAREQVVDVVALEHPVAQRFEHARRSASPRRVERVPPRRQLLQLRFVLDALGFDRLRARARAAPSTPSAGAPPARSSRISSSSSFSANTSSSSAGGTCFDAFAVASPRRSPSSFSRYSMRATGCLQRPVGVVQIRRPLEAGAPLGRRRVVEIVGMKLPAERAEALLEIRGVDRQLPRQPEEAK